MKNNNAYMAIGDGLTFLYAIPEDAYEQCSAEIKRECEQYMQQEKKENKHIRERIEAFIYFMSANKKEKGKVGEE